MIWAGPQDGDQWPRVLLRRDLLAGIAASPAPAAGWDDHRVRRRDAAGWSGATAPFVRASGTSAASRGVRPGHPTAGGLSTLLRDSVARSRGLDDVGGQGLGLLVIEVVHRQAQVA